MIRIYSKVKASKLEKFLYHLMANKPKGLKIASDTEILGGQF